MHAKDYGHLVWLIIYLAQLLKLLFVKLTPCLLTWGAYKLSKSHNTRQIIQDQTTILPVLSQTKHIRFKASM